MTDHLALLRRALGDRYEPVRELGSGGAAQVYLAEDVKHQRQVALKVLRPEFSISLGHERFLREIAVVARLQHPHILPLLDSGRAALEGYWSGWPTTGEGTRDEAAPKSELLYFVMPFVEGETLRTRIAREGQLPTADVVRILSDVADALAYAHEKGVVHRDIKPDNIMLAGRHAVVMDFGVAKAVSASMLAPADLTAGVALGTPAYMAPEQATADPTMDHRVDIYALGIVGYEMLTGRPPFSGATVHDLLAAQVLDDPDALDTTRADVPAELAAVVMRCLAKRPADRWASAAEVLAQLEPLSTVSGGMTPTKVTPVRARSSRRVMTIVAIAAVLLVGVIWRGARAMMRIPLDLRQGSILGTVSAAALSPDGQFIAVIARAGGDSTRLGVQEASGGMPRWLVTGLNLRHPSWSRDGTELRYTAYEESVHTLRAIPRLGGRPRYVAPMAGDFPAVSPDDQHLMTFRSGTRELVIRTLVTGATTTLVPPDGYNWSAGGAWSPSGESIALTILGLENQRSAIVCMSKDGRTSRLIVQDSVELSQPVWIGVHGALYYLRREGELQALRRLRLSGSCQPSGGPEDIIPGLDAGQRSPGKMTMSSLSFTADGRRMAYIRSVESSNIMVRAVGEASPTATMLTTGTAHNYAARLADGDTLLAFVRVAGGSSQAIVLPRHSMEETHLAGTEGAFALSWSPDGRALAVSVESPDRPDALALINLWSGTRKILASATPSAGLSWVGSDQVFFQRSGNRSFATVDTGSGSVSLVASVDTSIGHVFSPTTSPDGTAVAFYWSRPDNGGVWLVRVSGGSPELLSVGNVLEPIRWSPDGKQLYLARRGREGTTPTLLLLTLATRATRILATLQRDDFIEDISADGRTVLLAHQQSQSDVWLVNNPRPTSR